MKCPHCEYYHGWDGEIMDIVEGSQGDFWRHPVKMERQEDYETERIDVFGCPSCFKTFIGRG